MPKIFLDYGHGGSDPGSCGNGYKEKDLTLKFGLMVAQKLRAKGFTVGESRTSDVFVDLDSRGTMMKGYDYGVSFHLNAGGGCGYEFLVPIAEPICQIERHLDNAFKGLGANTRSSRCYSKDSATGAKYPRSFNGDNFGEHYKLTDWFSICRQAWAVGTSADIIELAFIDNIDDLNNFLNKMEQYADAFVTVLCSLFDLNGTIGIPEVEKPADKPVPAPTPTPSTHKYSVGTPICTNHIWASSTGGGNGYSGDWNGKITRVVEGAAHPYLINDGTGWTDDHSIDSDPHIPNGSKPTQPTGSTGSGNSKFVAPNSLPVGSRFWISENATVYGGQSYGVPIPSSIKEATTLYTSGGENLTYGFKWVLVNELTSWVKVSDCLVKR